MKLCPVTQLSTSNYNDGIHISYSVNLNDREVYFHFCRRCFQIIDFEKYRTVIFGFILNGKIDLSESILHWDCERDAAKGLNERKVNLKKLIEESYYPKTPKEKLDNLLIQLEKSKNKIYDYIDFTVLQRSEFFFQKCYFESYFECKNYLQALNRKGIIDCESFNEFDGSITFPITFEGLNYLAELENKGSESKNCFIAMAFNPEMEKVRIAIKKAITKTGFNPIIIDEQNINSDQTINDAIIAGIKNSKFCISDFSYHRNGVYFESGFALGLGKPVIYCCSKEEFSKAHFDIKPLQHIIYETEEELEKRLIDKIEAWIK